MSTPGSESPHTPHAAKAIPFASGRLDSWKEIAQYLNRDIRTVQRWEEACGLPVHRRPSGRLKGGPVYAYRLDLDAWLRQTPSPVLEKATISAEAGVALRRKRLWAFWVPVAVFTLVAVGATVWRFARPKATAPPLRVVRLTSYPGLARQPAFSPDGKQIAFSWNGENQDNFDVYVKFLDDGAPLRLTSHPGLDGWPAWSPDGRTIAFWRWARGTRTVEVMTVPALGGAERKILEFSIPPQPSGNYPGLAWTPDGKWILTPYKPDTTVPGRLALVSPETLEIRPLTTPPERAGDCCPAITPDGPKLAFLRSSGGRILNVYVLALGPNYRPEGEPRQLTRAPSGAENPMWTTGGREVLYITSRDGERALWRVPQDGSRPASRVESLGPVGVGWATSGHGDRLAYSDRPSHPALWRLDLQGVERLEQILSSSAANLDPEISPDGNRIAFISGRQAGLRVWISGSDAGNPIDIAQTVGPWPGPARWSPDGNYIAYECQNEGNDDICVVSARGGAARRVTRNPARDTLPSWSRDGKWIYFTSNRSGPYQVWKTPADLTDAAAVKLTMGEGFNALESADGSTLYFARSRFSSEIWKIPVMGGQEKRVGSFEMMFCRSQNYAVGRDGIYYVTAPDPEHWFELWLYRFATGKSESVRRIEKRIGEGLTISPDGHWLLFAADEARNGDLYMVENFR
ncbi:MAG: hypothetical protein LAQ69_43305 [Acidobacteriia bacterium]|nr:hypothetical protein [Terriglobia bacterium]